MRGAPVMLAITGGGSAWLVHLAASYFLVSLGCPRGWPGLGWTLGGTTVACAASALALAVAVWRGRRRGSAGHGDAGRFLVHVAVLLATLFAIMIVLGGLTVAALPPCQEAIGGE